MYRSYHQTTNITPIIEQVIDELRIYCRQYMKTLCNEQGIQLNEKPTRDNQKEFDTILLQTFSHFSGASTDRFATFGIDDFKSALRNLNLPSYSKASNQNTLAEHIFGLMDRWN